MIVNQPVEEMKHRIQKFASVHSASSRVNRLCRGFSRIRQHSEFRMLPFVILQRRQFNFRLPSIGPMYGDAIVSQSELREPFGVAAYLRAFCPGIAIAVQTNAAHSDEPA